MPHLVSLNLKKRGRATLKDDFFIKKEKKSKCPSTRQARPDVGLFRVRRFFFKRSAPFAGKPSPSKKMMSWAFFSFFFASRLGHLVHQEKSEPPIFGHFLLFCRKKNLQKNPFPSNDVISKQQNRPLLKLNNFESSFRFNTNYRVEK